MKAIRNIISGLIISSSVAANFAYATENSSSAPLLGLKENNRIGLLFFQQATSGFIKPISSGCYDLVLTKPNPEVMYFANSPAKVTGNMGLEHFAESMIHAEKIEKIKPNAILQMTLENQMMVNIIGNLSDTRYHNKQFHYVFCAFDDNPVVVKGKIRSINLFVDPIHRWPP